MLLTCSALILVLYTHVINMNEILEKIKNGSLFAEHDGHKVVDAFSATNVVPHELHVAF